MSKHLTKQLYGPGLMRSGRATSVDLNAGAGKCSANNASASFVTSITRCKQALARLP